MQGFVVIQDVAATARCRFICVPLHESDWARILGNATAAPTSVSICIWFLTLFDAIGLRCN